MRTVLRAWLVLLTLILVIEGVSRFTSVLGQTAPQKNAAFTGMIMDSKCATTGSHDAVMKKNGAKDARECTLSCAHNGSFVLYVPDTKKVYQLSNQEKPVPFAGQRVKVSGKYDAWSETIEEDAIEAAPAI